MLTPGWYPLRYHEPQAQLLTNPKRYKAVAAGRGSGKTECARRKFVMSLFQKKPWPDPKYFYVLPTADQANRVAWGPILDLIPPELIKRKNENRGIIETVFGSQAHIVSGEKPHRLEGVQWDGGIIDESSDERPLIFAKNLGPAMTHRRAWCWRIGVPKRRGIGAGEFHEFWKAGLPNFTCASCKKNYRIFLTGCECGCTELIDNADPQIASFHWLSKDILSEEEIEEKRRMMSPQDFREQYEASWEQTTGLIFQDFSNENITTDAIYHPSRPIVVGSDFNVDPMAWTISHFIDGRLFTFDEIFLRGTNTQHALTELYLRYGQHKAGWVFIGDATSRARKTAASLTDYIQIQNDTRFEPKELMYPKANPAVADRFAITNAAILNAQGERHLFVHPRVANLIRDFQTRYYKEGTTVPGDDEDPTHLMGHITDAIGYVCVQLIPMNVKSDEGRVIFR